MSNIDNLTEEQFKKLMPSISFDRDKKEDKQSEEKKEVKVTFKREGEAIMTKVVSFGYSFLEAKNKEERDKLIEKYCHGGESDLLAVREVYLIKFLSLYQFLSTKEENDESEEVKEALDLNERLIEGINNIMSYVYDKKIKEEHEEDEQRIKELNEKMVPDGETYNLAKVNQDGTMELVGQYTPNETKEENKEE